MVVGTRQYFLKNWILIALQKIVLDTVKHAEQNISNFS